MPIAEFQTCFQMEITNLFVISWIPTSLLILNCSMQAWIFTTTVLRPLAITTHVRTEGPVTQFCRGTRFHVRLYANVFRGKRCDYRYKNCAELLEGGFDKSGVSSSRG
ncbi:hypothetical protein OS493_018371 [Desmophyllum pertusum]|uniref:Uncharacterized protein n=1 Tax=Desmophyllum pertusum TaxID=174260 RepID=A0A9W9YCD6_9CNID|nr:hypothetical protein OS493_018371 [Desmophyllum pertusum]